MNGLNLWFRTPLGQAVMEAECELLTRRLAGVYAREVLQVGAYGRGQRPALFGNVRQWLVDNWASGPVDVCAEPHRLPFENHSVDVVLLLHQLEFSDVPHQVLREAVRVLAPEGHLVVAAFNPGSLWGLRRILAGRGGGTMPWTGRYYSRRRLEDWLSLLGLDVTWRAGTMLRPPIGNGPLFTRLERVERLGRRYGRWLGGIQITMAQKRVFGAAPRIETLRPKLAVLPGGLAQARSGVSARRNHFTR